jgi:hypothetical protein
MKIMKNVKIFYYFIIIILCVILFESCTAQKIVSEDDTITTENVYSGLHELIKDDTFNCNYEEKLIIVNGLFAMDFSSDDSSIESYTKFYIKTYCKDMSDKEKYNQYQISMEHRNEGLKYQSCVLNKCINYKITFKNLLQEISKTVYNKNYKSTLLEDLLNCDDRSDIAIEKLDSLNNALDKALKSLK